MTKGETSTWPKIPVYDETQNYRDSGLAPHRVVPKTIFMSFVSLPFA